MYKILIEKNAEKDLKSINQPFFQKIIDNIKELAENPRPKNCKKLKGIENAWRIRVGNYRVVYYIEDSEKVIKIMRIRHRKEVYH